MLVLWMLYLTLEQYIYFKILIIVFFGKRKRNLFNDTLDMCGWLIQRFPCFNFAFHPLQYRHNNGDGNDDNNSNDNSNGLNFLFMVLRFLLWFILQFLNFGKRRILFIELDSKLNASYVSSRSFFVFVFCIMQFFIRVYIFSVYLKRSDCKILIQ